jgi:quercetin dioxygenase-like cupin family protein
VSGGYEILSLDDLDRFPGATGATQVLLPIRRRLGFRPFGVNAWLGENAGDHVIERHREVNGHEELYVVLRGAAAFTLGDESFDAPVGTLVHARPGTLREATAAEPGTIVLAVGATPGQAFAPSPWEDFHVAFALLRRGEEERARALVQEALARDPDAWQGAYNAACFEAIARRPDDALEWLRTAVERGGTDVKGFADDDPDFDVIHGDPRYAEIGR